MSKLISISEDDKRRARLAGFKKRKPKKPKSKTVQSLERFITNYNRWATALKQSATKGKKLDDLRQAVAKV
jgi:hypothetical protein